MSHPDTTWTTAARRVADRIRDGIPAMLAEHASRDRDDDSDAFMVMAEQGARGYLQQLDEQLTNGAITELDVDKAELVATAVNCAGWISAAVPAGREAAMRELIADGYFELYERVPGQYVSCHRLVAPAVLMTPDAITRFTGEWEFLSNFFPAMLVWEGMYFPTSEHAFNAGKTLDVAERFWIAGAPTPAEAKRRGRSVALRPGWDETVRYEVMAEVLRAKFTCRTERTKLLLSTGTAELVEGNYHHDQHWGRCNCAAHAGRGDNHLGRLLMQLREELQA